MHLWQHQILKKNYLLQPYIVTSKPKRISVAWGCVHIVFLLFYVKYNIKHKAVHWRCGNYFPQGPTWDLQNNIKALVDNWYEDRHEDSLGKIIR